MREPQRRQGWRWEGRRGKSSREKGDGSSYCVTLQGPNSSAGGEGRWSCACVGILAWRQSGGPRGEGALRGLSLQSGLLGGRTLRYSLGKFEAAAVVIWRSCSRALAGRSGPSTKACRIAWPPPPPAAATASGLQQAIAESKPSAHSVQPSGAAGFRARVNAPATALFPFF